MRKHHTYNLILDLILESFPKEKKLNVLDYGCGSGALLEFFPKNRIGKYTGIDINKDSIDVANKRYGGGKNISFGLISSHEPLNLGKANTVDVVVAVGVLQYMADDQRVNLFQKAESVLRKDGVLVLSCVTDHILYKLMNLYYLFLPHYYINRANLIKQLRQNNFRIVYERERGLIIAPLFSNLIVLFFDTLDKIFFRTRGELGPIGTRIRQLASQIIQWEYKLPIDYGHTLFVKSQCK